MTPVEEIKERLNIVEVVGEYVQLKNAGANHKGLCPFHNETTPSFTVSEGKQFFHCFGCSKGGDVFTFLQEVENMEFAEALRVLAKKAGVELKATNPREHNEKTRLIDCMALAAQYFHLALKQSQEGQRARDYIAKRGFDDEIIETFQLGYSADSWDALMNFLKKKGFTQKEIERSGLIVPSKKNGKFYDRFRGRLMFPINDVHGNVVGFTARTLEKEHGGAKYINTPETPLYNKSRVIYGLHLAKQYIKKMDATVIVEGNADVVTAHQFKFRNVVATSGTALTIDQVKLLKRFSPNIIIAFDADAAGIQAAWRGMQVAVQQGMNIKVMSMPDGQDPDDLIREDAAQFRQLAIEAKPFMQYAFDAVLSELDISRVDHKKEAATRLLPMIALFPDEIEQMHYLRLLGEKVGVSAELLKDRLMQGERDRRIANQPQHVRPPQQQDQFEGQYAEQSQAPARATRFQKMAGRLIALMSMDGADISYAVEHLPGDHLPEGEPKALYKLIEEYYNQHRTFDSKQFFETLDQSHQASWRKVQLIAEELYGQASTQERQTELRTLFESIEHLRIKSRLRAVQQELTEAEYNNDNDAIQRLSEEVRQLTELLKKTDH